MFKDIRTYLIAGLALAVVLLILFWPKKPETTQVKAARDSIQVYKAKEQAAIKAGEAIKKDLHDNKVKYSIAQEAFKREIRGLKKKAQEKRIVIQQVIDTIPAVAEFIVLQDSIILADSIRILQLTMEKQVMEKGFNFLLAEKQNECDALKGMNANLDYINNQQRKDLRKVRRGSRLLKISVVALPVAGLLLGSQL